MNIQQLENLYKMRQLCEQIQSKEKELKDFDKSIDDLSKREHIYENNKLSEEHKDLKKNITNYKNQIKDLESKIKSNEEIISKLRSENEQLKRGRNHQS